MKVHVPYRVSFRVVYTLFVGFVTLLDVCVLPVWRRYVGFCMKRVNLLLEHGVEPIMVFDGASLPIKQDKNLERRRCVRYVPKN